jgi:hopanoid biosynthesis associated protein HpnK
MLRRQIIINGDDFGFSSSVNHGIIKAHDLGILTSTSLMVTGEAFDEAVALAKTRPTLAVGLHLVLTCGQSALPASQVPHLVDATGQFSHQATLAGLKYQFSRAAQQEIPLEIRAQLEKFRATGLPLSHVDGHLHLHVHPLILRHLVNLADEFQIPVIRLPYEELSINLSFDRDRLFDKLFRALIFLPLRRYGERLLRLHDIQFAERVYGLLQTSSVQEDYLLDLIPRIQADRVEIYSHPSQAIAENFRSKSSGETELEALLSSRVRCLLEQNGFVLTNFREWKSECE